MVLLFSFFVVSLLIALMILFDSGFIARVLAGVLVICTVSSVYYNPILSAILCAIPFVIYLGGRITRRSNFWYRSRNVSIFKLWFTSTEVSFSLRSSYGYSICLADHEEPRLLISLNCIIQIYFSIELPWKLWGKYRKYLATTKYGKANKYDDSRELRVSMHDGCIFVSYWRTADSWNSEDKRGWSFNWLHLWQGKRTYTVRYSYFNYADVKFQEPTIYGLIEAKKHITISYKNKLIRPKRHIACEVFVVEPIKDRHLLFTIQNNLDEVQSNHADLDMPEIFKMHGIVTTYVPHPGKGENSWDQGEDGTCATHFGGDVDGIEEFYCSVIKRRAKYGSYTWMPEVKKEKDKSEVAPIPQEKTVNKIKDCGTFGDKADLTHDTPVKDYGISVGMTDAEHQILKAVFNKPSEFEPVESEEAFIEKMKQRAAENGSGEWYEKELEKQKAIEAFEQAKAVSAGSDYDVDKKREVIKLGSGADTDNPFLTIEFISVEEYEARKAEEARIEQEMLKHGTIGLRRATDEEMQVEDKINKKKSKEK